MNVIVPLAGPDFINQRCEIKALTSFNDSYLLKYILENRHWAKKVNSYTFVLRDTCEARAFALDYLNHWFNKVNTVFISQTTRGAALSALSGLSIQSNLSDLVVVDLADIHYNSYFQPQSIFESDASIGALVPVFQSSDPIYSYLELDDSGEVLETAEKRVISTIASAGTYIFRDTTIFMSALIHSIRNESTQSYANNFFLCPLMNGVIKDGHRVVYRECFDVVDIKNTSSFPKI